jgi:hypothetical protein
VVKHLESKQKFIEKGKKKSKKLKKCFFALVDNL